MHLSLSPPRKFRMWAGCRTNNRQLAVLRYPLASLYPARG
jgi:hypothetical protein